MIVLRHCLIATLLAASACAAPQGAPPEPTTQAGEPSWRERMQARRAGRAAGRESDTVSIEEFAFMHDGQARWYTVYAPDNLRPGAAAIVLLHGGTSSMRKLFNAGAASGQAWRDVADREGVLLIVPNGVNAETGDTKGDRQNWNDFRKPGSPRNTNADDVGFITALVDEMVETYQLDPNQVFVTGASNGGMMTYRLLIDAPEAFAAGAAFIANFPEGNPEALQPPARPTPIMIMNGTEDRLIPYDGGEVGRNLVALMSTAETVDWWVEANKSNPDASAPYQFPDTDPGDNCRISRVIHAAMGDGSAPVHLFTMHGGGHAMPSKKYIMPETRLTTRLIGQQCRDVEGADLAWEFFRSARP
ncbi:MAG: alpha/beta hydrolase family esterase [Alphaproteobacteria bacterium]